MLFLIIIIICFVLQLFLPWWIIAPLAFGAAFWKAHTGGHAFGSGFFGVLTLWICTGLYYTLPNGNILANRVGAMLGLPPTPVNWVMILLISGLLGGLAAGFCALAGYYFRQVLVLSEKPKTK
jgi:hypothetical protein